MKTNVLVMGVGFFPVRAAGDKNFWVDLLPLLVGEDTDLTVVSVNDLPSSRNTVASPQWPVGLVNWRRSFHGRSIDRFYAHDKAGGWDFQHKHSPAVEQMELLGTLLTHLPELRRLVRQREIRVVHFMDNMGFAMPALKLLFPRLRVTHSAMTYMPRGRNYDRYLSICMRRLDKIAPYSEAYARILPRLGVSKGRIEIIRWGVAPRRHVLSPEARQEVKVRLGLKREQKLILWSGFIQQIKEADFRKAVTVAKTIALQRDDAHFVFSFKPRSFKEEYAHYGCAGISIGQPDVDFPLLLGSADFYLSPIGDLRSTVAPPLTWIEAMNCGVPVITTPALGTDEAIIDGRTGYIGDGTDGVVHAISRALDDPDHEAVSLACRRTIEERFDINKSAQAYRQMWRMAAEQEG